MATTVRLASERVKASDGKTLAQEQFSGAGAVNAHNSYGTGGGWKDDINHWSHSGVSVSTFNALVPSGETGLGDVSKYVSIVTNPGDSDGLNDGDLIIKNPYAQNSGVDMILTIQQDDKGIVTAPDILCSLTSIGNDSIKLKGKKLTSKLASTTRSAWQHFDHQCI